MQKGRNCRGCWKKTSWNFVSNSCGGGGGRVTKRRYKLPLQVIFRLSATKSGPPYGVTSASSFSCRTPLLADPPWPGITSPRYSITWWMVGGADEAYTCSVMCLNRFAVVFPSSGDNVWVHSWGLRPFSCQWNHACVSCVRGVTWWQWKVHLTKTLQKIVNH